MKELCRRGPIERFVSPDEWAKVVCALLEDEYCRMLPRFVLIGEHRAGDTRDGRGSDSHG